jgi:hypothetical protein
LAEDFDDGFLLAASLLHIPEGVDCRLDPPPIREKRRCSAVLYSLP